MFCLVFQQGIQRVFIRTGITMGEVLFFNHGLSLNWKSK